MEQCVNQRQTWGRGCGSVYIRVIYLFKVTVIIPVSLSNCPISKGMRLSCVCTKLIHILKLGITSFVDNFVYKPILLTSVCLNTRCTIYKAGIIHPN